MGMCASAHLAYGYDLGNNDGFFCAERGEYGPNLPWLDDEDDDFAGQAEDQLFRSVGFTEVWDPSNDGYYQRRQSAQERVGVNIYHSGHVEYSGWMLVVTASIRTVDWAGSMEIEPNELINTPCHKNWDTKLAAAVTALGITPDTSSPKWLVFPSYG